MKKSGSNVIQSVESVQSVERFFSGVVHGRLGKDTEREGFVREVRACPA